MDSEKMHSQSNPVSLLLFFAALCVVLFSIVGFPLVKGITVRGDSQGNATLFSIRLKSPEARYRAFKTLKFLGIHGTYMPAPGQMNMARASNEIAILTVMGSTGFFPTNKTTSSSNPYE